MKVKDLIKELKQLPPNTEVVISSDSEGNNYSLLDALSLHGRQVVLYPEDMYFELDDVNTCDKCKKDMDTESLVWLTTEDFTPLTGEVLKDEVKNYDAVCEPCYQTLLVK